MGKYWFWHDLGIIILGTTLHAWCAVCDADARKKRDSLSEGACMFFSPEKRRCLKLLFWMFIETGHTFCLANIENVKSDIVWSYSLFSHNGPLGHLSCWIVPRTTSMEFNNKNNNKNNNNNHNNNRRKNMSQRRHIQQFVAAIWCFQICVFLIFIW